MTDPYGPVGPVVRVITGESLGGTEAGSVLDAITAARRWIGVRHNWVRVGWFATGGVVLVLGLVIMFRGPLGRGGAVVAGQVKDAGAALTMGLTKGKAAK